MQKRIIFILVGIFAATGVQAQVTGLSGWDIYIDPGHSRTENMGIFGYSEAEKNVRVGLHLRDLLLSNTDIDTVYNSRFNDQITVSLSQRTDEANSIGASWFHSIHSDAGPSQLNSTLLLWGQLRNGQEKTPNGGRSMAGVIVDLLTRAMRTNTRGSIGDCSFYGCDFTGPYLSVNRRSAMPSELSEAGFHTSPVQNPRNMNKEWKRLEAYSLYWAILQFHEIERPPVGIVTGFVTDIEKDRPLNGARIRIGGQEYTTDTFESLFHNYSNDPEQLQNGFYFLENLPNDTLQMIVSADNFYSDTSTVALVDTFFTFKDVNLISSLPPTVVLTAPLDGETFVPIKRSIGLKFSRRMNPAATDSALSITPTVDFTTSWSDNNRSLSISTDTLANLTEYTVTVAGSAHDLFEHPFDGNGDGLGGDSFSFSFTTQPVDITAPRVETVYPANGATGVENPPIINFVFDERLSENSIAAGIITLEGPGQVAVPGILKHYVVNGKSLLTFFPGQTLDVGASYTLRLLPGLKDEFGNTTQSEHNSTFETAGTIYDVLPIDRFETRVTNNWWAPQQSGSTGGIITGQTSRGTNREFVNLTSNSRQSMQLNYGWDINAGSWFIREFLGGGTPRAVTFDRTFLLQMYVFGDGSGNKIRFALDDKVPTAAAGNHEVSQWYAIDWVGWRLITWDLANDPVGNWIGDGRLDGALRIDSIQLTHATGAAESGALYFDDLKLLRAKPTSVEDGHPLPERFTLAQNYPNPFNPTTTIRFSLPGNPQHVKLAIYDMLGRLVQVLIDEIVAGGDHSVIWNGRDRTGFRVASGTYIYKIQTPGFVKARRMVLLK